MNQFVGVVKAYNSERLRRGKRAVKYGSPKTRENVWRLINWCGERNIDPVDYVQVVSSLFQVLFPLGRLGNKRCYACYMAHYQDREDHQQHQNITLKSEPKIRPSQEKFKSRYGSNPYLCLVQRQYTGGFNNRSSHCQQCMYRWQCQTN